MKGYAADEVYDPGNGDMRFRHNWEHMQQIKNDIAGEDAKCFEVYSAQSRVVNTDNVYWLFVMPPGQSMSTGILWMGQKVGRCVLSGISKTSPRWTWGMLEKLASWKLKLAVAQAASTLAKCHCLCYPSSW